MKKGIVILCRYNSTRLPGKILKEIHGKPILAHIIQAVRKVTDNFIVATSKKETDNSIVDYCISNNIKFYRGSLNNVAKRFYKAAKSIDLDYAVRINGDNLFVNTAILKKMFEIPDASQYDLLSNVPGRTFPFGMSVEMVNLKHFKKARKHFTDRHKEHVTLYYYENIEKSNNLFFENNEVPEGKGVNLAIDTMHDFEKADYIIKQSKKEIGSISLKELVNLALEFEK